jgi:Na+/H+ antiporter NhaC
LKSRVSVKVVGSLIVLGVVCALAAFLASPNQKVPQQGKWYSIVPPLLAIALAFLTHRVLLSLGVAFVVGSLLTHVAPSPLSFYAWLDGLETVGIVLANTLNNRTNLQILAFIPPIFVMMQVVITSGGFEGILVWVSRWVKSGKSAQLATALMGIVCFIDDYANAIIVGTMMQPVTDRFRVSREKLAFIVDATSAPISGLAIISTWIAYEVGLFGDIARQLGIDKNGYSMFFDALSFRFYCLLMIFFVFLLILTRWDFGPMRASERLARGGERKKGGGSGPSKEVVGSHCEEANLKSGRAVNALVPLGGFILFHLLGLWVDGNGPSRLGGGGSLLSWVYWREVIAGAKNSTLVLDSAAIFGLILALCCARLFGSLRVSTLGRCSWHGLKRAATPCAILILAWSLKNCCELLKTGEFLTTILAERISPQWFPPILFLVASITSFATGTSFGTMAILIPTAIPIAFALDGHTYGLTTMISLGAVLDGAIFGDHCSPISDTTIISSVASSCDLVQHVRTQLPYSLLVAGVALSFAYVPCAFGFAPAWSLILAALVMVGFLLAVAWWQRKASG